jgi:nucleotide-binding universal stress UspA family protein
MSGGGMINTILFATDLGPFTDYTLQHVTELAKNCNASIVVVHAVEPLSTFAQAVVETYLDDSHQEAFVSADTDGVLSNIKHKILEALADEYMESDTDVARISGIHVLQGRPAQVILRQAKDDQADLIVMGSHGAQALDGNVIGSVTSKVLQLSKVPVFMVPMMDPQKLHGQPRKVSGASLR